MIPDIDRTEVRNGLNKALAEVLKGEVPELTDDLRLFGDLALDSTSVIELLMALEDSLGLLIDPDELTAAAFETVGSLTSYLLECLTAGRKPVS
jgi:acyl carrier protein